MLDDLCDRPLDQMNLVRLLQVYSTSASYDNRIKLIEQLGQVLQKAFQ